MVLGHGLTEHVKDGSIELIIFGFHCSETVRIIWVEAKNDDIPKLSGSTMNMRLHGTFPVRETRNIQGGWSLRVVDMRMRGGLRYVRWGYRAKGVGRYRGNTSICGFFNLEGGIRSNKGLASWLAPSSSLTV